MPGISGLDLLQNLKNSAKFKGIPFLMITSESETEKVIKAIVHGVADFLVKPFDEEVLSQKLTAIWKRTRHNP